MRLYSGSRLLDLVCHEGHCHFVRENHLDIDDDTHAEELLNEYPGVLSKNEVNEVIVTIEVSPTVEVSTVVRTGRRARGE